MNIFETYNLYQEIKHSPNKPRLSIGLFYEMYTLEGQNYNMQAKATYSRLSDNNLVRYSFATGDKKSGKVLLDTTGFKARILFNQMRTKAGYNQKRK